MAAITSGGVPAGARSPCHAEISTSGKPDSAMVGRSGSCGTRAFPATAIGLRRPALMKGSTAGSASKSTSTCPPDEVVQRRAGALVGHAQEFDACLLLEHLGEQVRRAAQRRDRHRQLARPRLRVGDEFRDGAHRHRRMHEQQVGDLGDDDDRREVLRRRERQVRVERRRGRHRAERALHERVAVRRGLGDEVGADVAAAARAVLDHEGLAELVGEDLRRKSRDQVRRAARRIGRRRSSTACSGKGRPPRRDRGPRARPPIAAIQRFI